MSFIYNDKDKYEQLIKISNPDKVVKNAIKYFNDPNIKIYLSTMKDHKYYIFDDNLKKVHFGSMAFSDFTKHNNLQRRQAYLNRSAGIRGDWKDNKYSRNNLSRILLWDANSEF